MFPTNPLGQNKTALQSIMDFFDRKEKKTKRRISTSGWGLERGKIKRLRKRKVRNKIAYASRRRNRLRLSMGK